MTTWMDKGVRDEVDMAQFATADPRDAEIENLRAAWGIALKSGEGLLMLCGKQNERIAELEAQLEIYRNNLPKRVISIDGQWIGQSFADLDAQAAEYQARIAELEAALREIRPWTYGTRLVEVNGKKYRTEPMEHLSKIGAIVDAALMPPPERDMTITHEELGA